MRESTVVVQPENRGTAPAVLYALFRIAQSAPNDLVAFLTSDHLISNDHVSMEHVNQALEGCRQRIDLIERLSRDRARVLEITAG